MDLIYTVCVFLSVVMPVSAISMLIGGSRDPLDPMTAARAKEYLRKQAEQNRQAEQENQDNEAMLFYNAGDL